MSAAAGALAPYACPACRARLGADLACGACRSAYGRVDGIPALVRPAVGEATARQRDWFDARVDAEWEIRRPHGAPALHRLSLERRFRLAFAGLEEELRGATALVVCGGSGMDAELLARAGARVTTSDVSPGACRRAVERARRFGLDLDVVVAEAERLPFPDRSFDVVSVHDGLHHLPDPRAALREMARVAARAVVVAEPARALATRLALPLGLALAREEAGNDVRRFRREDVAGPLRDAGFRVVAARRHAMLYRHEPGACTRAISRAGLAPAALRALAVVDALAGALGNKLVVQAAREDA